MEKRIKKNLILLLILFFAFLLRFIYISSIPPELNRDEVSVGFNAYSLLKTGKDEHGQGPWPLVFRAFGDYKIPGYIYMTIPFIKIFGLNAFSVRFPAAFFGFLTIVTSSYFIKELYPKNKNLHLLVPLLFTFMPFHLHYSRQQFETTVALFFSLTGITFLLKARKKVGFLFLSLPFFVVSFFIYNTPLFVIPPLVVFTLFIFKKDLVKEKKPKLLSLFFIFLLAVGWFGYWNLVKEGNAGRANTTIFNQKTTIEEINRNIHLLNNKGFPIVISRLFYNKPVYWLRNYLKNYVAAFSPNFLFFNSDDNPWHSIGHLNIGNILIIFLPFILLGIYKSLSNLNNINNLWLMGFLLISLIGNGLTIDSPILTRLMHFHFVLVCFAALGLVEFFHGRFKKKNLVNLTVLAIIVFSSLNYLISYFLIFPQDMPYFWMPGIKQTSLTVKELEPEFDFVLFDPDISLGYIFLAFYLPFEPQDFQTNAKRQTIGFDNVTSYGKFIFDHKVNSSIRVDDFDSEFGKNPNLLLVQRLDQESSSAHLDNEILIYGELNRPTFKIIKLKLHD